ncbi:hypothetical protein HIM_06322 [Hirsutella minnesotensis 3608]|uniref:Uncharacterized protein n=1 Tax=Hirsutella minnesotensis 3608 TaxID=1043627 RepID=A0A0F7ZJE3_9HYPO|nr:hypothetical protein HIM_06322 [Hirsutella minnesotensis 3608]
MPVASKIPRLEDPHPDIVLFWTRPSSNASRSIRSLERSLDVRVICNPNWPQIFEQLAALYHNPQSLIVSVTDWFSAYCQVLVHRFTQEEPVCLLGSPTRKLASNVHLLVELRVRQRGESRAISFTNSSIILNIPSNTGADEPDHLDPVTISRNVKEALDFWFNNPDPGSVPEGGNELLAAFPPENEQRTDVTPPRKMPQLSAITTKLLDGPPYSIMIQSISVAHLNVVGNHPSSIYFIADALKKLHAAAENIPEHMYDEWISSKLWLRIRVKDSAFGFEDSTLMVQERDMSLADSIILEALQVIFKVIETMLGYHLVSDNGGIWHYERDEPFEEEPDMELDGGANPGA